MPTISQLIRKSRKKIGKRKKTQKINQVLFALCRTRPCLHGFLL